MYIDVYCFCVVKMEDLYPVAVSFRFFVPNRGFTPRVGEIRDILFSVQVLLISTVFASCISSEAVVRTTGDIIYRYWFANLHTESIVRSPRERS